MMMKKYLVWSDKVIFFLCLTITIYTSLAKVDNETLMLIEVIGYAYVFLITTAIFIFSKEHRERILQWIDHIV